MGEVLNSPEIYLQHLEELDLSKWVVVYPTSGRALIGVPTTPLTRGTPHTVLCPALEFSAELISRPGPAGQPELFRVPMLSPVDFATTALVPQHVQLSRFYLLRDLDPADREEYSRMVRQALDHALQIRARRSNIAVAGSSIKLVR